MVDHRPDCSVSNEIQIGQTEAAVAGPRIRFGDLSRTETSSARFGLVANKENSGLAASARAIEMRLADGRRKECCRKTCSGRRRGARGPDLASKSSAGLGRAA